MNNPLLLISWKKDFLTTLLEILQQDGPLADCLIIVPHSRPEMYIQQMLAQSASLPLILPEVLPSSTLFSTLREHMHKSAASPAATLDSVGLLLEASRDILQTGQPLQAMPRNDLGSPFPGKTTEQDEKIPLQDAQRFFPWGVRLADLFEECFNHHCHPEDFQYMEGEVVPFAANLLDNLRSIYDHYVQNLRSRNWTTPGLDASAVISALEDGQSLPEHLFSGKRIYIAGFHALNRTQDILFKHLWKEYGAKFIIHADPKLPEGHGHWSCRNFLHLAKSWQTDIELVHGPEHCPAQQGQYAAHGTINGNGKTADATDSLNIDSPELEFIAGFDLHSQLQALCQRLPFKATRQASPANNASAQQEKCPENPQADHSADTAIILPDSALLMPLLHHLPEVDCNISMGYPLSRSPVFALLDILFTLQEKRLETGFYWKGLLELFRHPYLKMLSPEAQPLEEQVKGTKGKNQQQEQTPSTKAADLRAEMHILEKILRHAQQTYLLPQELLQTLQGEMLEISPQAKALLEKLFACCFGDFARVQTTKDMGKSLEKLCSLLLEHGRHLWVRFPIDAEGLHRILQTLIPELLHNSLAEEKFLPAALFSITRQLIHTQRVPFQASPLVGLQVMGMLESRLLTFKHLYILDSVDASLPGTASGNPLFPDSLRPILGLPPVSTREQVAAYHFFRLVQSSEKVTLLWREGVTGSGLQDQIPQKSRFVEELLWQKEKKLGKLLKANGDDEKLHFLESTVAPLRTGNKHLYVTDAMRELVEKRLRKNISASFLDSYLQCPVRWYYEHIAKLASPEDIEEKYDPLAVGELLHKTLQEFYRPYLGMEYDPALMDTQDQTSILYALFLEELEKTSLPRTLPADAMAILKAAAHKRFAAYLEAQPKTTIIALEKNLSSPFTFDNQNLILFGRVDRVDFREDTLLVLDYKTGHLPVLKNIWDDAAFWRRLESWKPGSDLGSPLLHAIYQNIPSLQLPFYIFLLGAEHRGLLASTPLLLNKFTQSDAAFVDLRESCREKNFLTHSRAENIDAKELQGNIATLVSFIVRHMLESPVFCPQKSELCHWCSAEKMCMVFRK